MRILIVNYEYPPLGGGGGIETRDLAEELARRHEVHVLTTWYKDLPTEEMLHGVHVHRVRVWGRTQLPTSTFRSLLSFAPLACLRGVRLMRDVRPDLVNAHFVVPSGVPAVLLAQLFRRPFVLTIIGGDIYDPSKGVSPHRHALLRMVVGWIIRRATAVTAISWDTKERAMQYHRAPSSIEVIPLGLVPPTIPPRAPGRQSAGPFQFIAVGRLIPRKGYLDLLRGFAAMEERRAILRIVGDGPLAPDLRRVCAELGVADRVIFHGRVSDDEKFHLLGEADAYVSASLHEGFGICFLEAMYMGLPIIATDTGGQTDFLVAGQNAILVPSRRPEQITHAMDWLVRDGGLREALARANAARVQEYLIRRTAERYEGMFERLVSAR